MGILIFLNNNYIYKRRKRYSMPDISKERKIEIEQEVHNIFAEAGYNPFPQNSLIVDIVQLVKAHDFAVQTSEMELNTTGCLIVNDLEPVMDTNKKRLIVINKNFKNNNNDNNVVLKKSRFITAHEYGHFVLHKKEDEPIYAHRDTDRRTEPEELEADYFARSILMPFELFERYIRAIESLHIYNDIRESIPLLSTIFKVTKDKASKRLNDLEELKGCI